MINQLTIFSITCFLSIILPGLQESELILYWQTGTYFWSRMPFYRESENFHLIFLIRSSSRQYRVT